MAGILHVQCPACKGAIGVTEIDRVVTCPYCEARSLVEKGMFVPEYLVEATVDADAARRALRRALKDPRMTAGLLEESRFSSAVLRYVPFHKTAARRVGTLQVQEEARRPSLLSGARPGEGRVTVANETRVVFGDVARMEPAVRMSGWELEHAAIMDREREQEMTFLPYDPEDASRGGAAMPATERPDRYLEELKTDSRSATVVDRTSYSQIRVRRIYYPVWRVRYQYKGRGYAATVDGVTGDVIALRAPQDDGSRVKWLIATAMVLSLFFGKSLGFVLHWVVFGAGNGLANYDMTWVMALLLVILLFAVLVFSTMGWHQFRYPGEVVIRGAESDVEKVGGKEDSGAMGWLIRLGDAIGGVFERGAPRG